MSFNEQQPRMQMTKALDLKNTQTMAIRSIFHDHTLSNEDDPPLGVGILILGPPASNGIIRRKIPIFQNLRGFFWQKLFRSLMIALQTLHVLIKTRDKPRVAQEYGHASRAYNEHTLFYYTAFTSTACDTL